MTKTLRQKLIVAIHLICAICIFCGVVFCIVKAEISADAALPKAWYVEGTDSPDAVRYGSFDLSDDKGVAATLEAKQKLVLRSVVDLNDYPSGEPFLKVMPITNKKGDIDYASMKIELVDVYDESNYITVQVKPTQDAETSSDVSYVLACASNGQRLSGLDRGGTKIHTVTWGTWVHLNFYGAEKDKFPLSINTLSLGFNADTKTLYIYDEYTQLSVKVADFDDPKFFGTDLWNGFTGNEIFVRISLGDYVSAAGGVLVTKYGDTDLSEDIVQDADGPRIAADLKGYAENALPEAVVNLAYPVFAADAFDLYSGDCGVVTEVYMNYYSGGRVKQSVKNGAFTPKIAGTYYIVYKATDKAGNVSEKVLEIVCRTAENTLDIAFDNFVSQAKAGELYTLPEYRVTGGSGEKTVSVRALNGGETLAVGDGVRPVASGEMKLEYTVTDFLGQIKVIEKSVAVAAADKPTFIELPVLPAYFVEGNEYLLPSVSAYNFISAAGDKVSTQIKIAQGGAETSLQSGKYIPSVSNSGDTVKVIYEAEINSAVNRYEREIPVLKVRSEGLLDMSKYFVSDNGRAVTRENSVEFQAAATDTFTFANAVCSAEVRIEFEGSEKTNNLSALNICLTDIADASKKLKFTYEKSLGKVIFYVNDDRSRTYEATSSFKDGDKFELRFDESLGQVSFDVKNGLIVPVETFVNGENFGGFDLHKAYVSFEVVGKDTSLALVSINGNYFSNETDDYIGPVIYVMGEYGGDYALNETFVIPPVLGCDVLSGDAAVTMTLTTPSGRELYTNQAVDASFKASVVLEEYGNYSVEYTCRDSTGLESMFSYQLSVVDREKPVIVLSENRTTKAKVGEIIPISAATVSDNCDETPSVVVYVICPDGRMVELADDVTMIKAQTAGRYSVLYSAVDAAGNLTAESYDIIVE
ncbi:MAG: hypothetical protein DBX59_02365 [Bacillota bacterium]|nr:MAG: hypothetical protein DBX59_02365 [Bacillota bacterium]